MNSLVMTLETPEHPLCPKWVDYSAYAALARENSSLVASPENRDNELSHLRDKLRKYKASLRISNKVLEKKSNELRLRLMQLANAKAQIKQLEQMLGFDKSQKKA